jgi:hypothetical protein
MLLRTWSLAVMGVVIGRCDTSSRAISLDYVDGGDQKHRRQLAGRTAGTACYLASQFVATARSAGRDERQHRGSDTASRAARLGRSGSSFVRRILEFDSGRLVPDEGCLSPAGAARCGCDQKILSTRVVASCGGIRTGVPLHRRHCSIQSQPIPRGGSWLPAGEPAALSLSCALRCATKCDPSYDCEAPQARAGFGNGPPIRPQFAAYCCEHRR